MDNKAQLYFRQNITMQWYEAYINYLALEGRFKQLKAIRDEHLEQFFEQGSQYQYLRKPTSQVSEKIRKLIEQCEGLIEIGKNKFWAFYIFKKYQIIHNCQELQKIMREISKSEIITHQDCVQRYYLKSAIKLFFANCYYLRKFLEFNSTLETKTNMMVTLYRLIENEDGQMDNKSIQSEPQMQINSSSIKRTKRKNSSISAESEEKHEVPSTIAQQIQFLLKIQHKSKELYMQLIFYKQQKSHRLDQLVELHEKNDTSKTYVLVGLYCGMSLISFLAIFVFLVFGIVTPSFDPSHFDSMYYVFPLFRGIGLFILYLWGMAWNAYGFCKYKISFRRILKYGFHYSTYMMIIKRASFFTLIFCLMLLLYFIGDTYNQANIKEKKRFPIQYTPFIVWMLYLGYIFFPQRELFNPQGRKYFYRVIKEVLLSPFGQMSFLISWLTDQTVSFIYPIKDMAYTICFYTSDFNNQEKSEVQNCLNHTAISGFLVAYLIALFPLLFRMVQCYRQAVQDEKGSGKFIGHTQMWNFGKYASSLITATISYFNTISTYFLVPLIISSVLSTAYAYYWDLKHDWGFLQKNSKHRFLRNHLSYRQPYFYYIAIGINLLFRLSWTLSISPFTQSLTPSPAFPMVLGLIEILRRCMWNFFRIEKEHIINCRNYSATQNINDPIKSIRKLQETENKTNNTSITNNTESILYLYKKHHKNFLQESLLPQNYELKVEQETIDEKKKEFQIWLRKEQDLIRRHSHQ